MNFRKVTLATALSLSLSTAAFAGDKAMVFYSDIVEPTMIDMAPKGPSLGDMYVRNGAVRSSENGPVIGEYFSQATIIMLDTANDKAARSYMAEIVLAEGTIYHQDIVQLNHGRPIEEGHKHSGAIIGGTGKYAGIRGSYDLELLKGGNKVDPVVKTKAIVF
jgi:hypothetical protein